MKLHKAKFVWRLAKRDLLEDWKISVIVVVMLSFSFLNLVFFPAFISGLSYSFTEGLIEGRTGHLAIEAEDGMIENPDALIEKISRLEGVENTEKVLEFPVTAIYEGEESHVTVKGTDATGYQGYSSKIEEGSWLTEDTDEAVIGRFIAREDEKSGVEGLGIERGRILRITGENFSKKFKVRGVIGTEGGIAGMSKKIYITFEQAEKLAGTGGGADKIKVLLDERTDSAGFKEKLQELNVKGELRTWKEQSNMAEGITGTFGIVINILSVVGLIVALAAVGVVIFINTSKRVREMGIVRAIGARRVQVIEIFMLEAVLFGLAGVIVGNIMTLGIDAALGNQPIQSPVGPISTRIDNGLLLTRSVWMLAASVVAGFVPAYLTSKTEIVETIENR